jgi:hypothetical protein
MSKQSIPNPRRQPGAVDYAQRVLLNEAAKAGDSKAMPMPDANATSLQRPTDAPIPTVSTRNVPDPQK